MFHHRLTDLNERQPAAIAQHIVHAPVNAPITVHATPGMDESALARHIGEGLDKRQRKAGAQAWAALNDIV